MPSKTKLGYRSRLGGRSVGMEIYNTGAIAPQERAVHWSALISETYFPLMLDYQDANNFTGQLQRRLAGPASLSRLTTQPAQYIRESRHIEPYCADHYLVTIPHGSPVGFEQLDRQITCPPGGFFIEQGSEPYVFSYEEPNDLFVIKIARGQLDDRLSQPDRLCAISFDGTEGLGGLFTETARRLHAMPHDPVAADILGAQMIDLLALAVDRQAEVAHNRQSVVQAAHLERARAAVRQNIRRGDLNPEQIARLCGISKRYLHSLFKDTGVTVSQYIRNCRLQAAAEALSMPSDQRLSVIAYRLGFSDQAQFSRQFRERYGQTPSDYRHRQRTRFPIT